VPQIVEQLTSKLASYVHQARTTPGPDTEIVEAIYASHHSDRAPTSNSFGQLLSQVAGGSSDLEIQAQHAGAIPGSSCGLMQDMQGLENGGRKDEGKVNEESDDDDDDDDGEDEDDDDNDGDNNDDDDDDNNNDGESNGSEGSGAAEGDMTMMTAAQDSDAK
jgi:hypothetical protein